MATVLKAILPQSLAEIRTYPVDYTDDLLLGVTVSSAQATHVPPEGGDALVPTVLVTSPYVYVTVPKTADLGMHELRVEATLSNGDISEVRIFFEVSF